MSLKLLNLDSKTRHEMIKELDFDISKGTVYISKRLNNNGKRNWVELLKQAIEGHDDNWLADQILSKNMLEDKELSTRNGKSYVKRVPENAHITLSESEFNRLYIRGLCSRAISEKVISLVIYRAKESYKPRDESEIKIGNLLDPSKLLDDLRNSNGKTPSYLPEVNSGLSVKIP